MARRSKSMNDIEQVDYYEEESDGFSEGDVVTGTVLSAFSFQAEPNQGEVPVSAKDFLLSPTSAPTGKQDAAYPSAFELNPVSAPGPKYYEAAPKALEVNSEKSSAGSLIDTRKINTEFSAPTPSIDGEIYSVGRYYKLRYSTAKMLNEIKASHEDVNVYMNTIVDEAIRWYYEYLFQKEKG